MVTDVTNLHKDNFIHTSLKWSSILAGVAVSLLIGIIFNVLGIALGLSVFSSTVDTLSFLTYGTIAWLIGGVVIATFIGGWIAGHFNSGLITRASGLLHGFTAGVVAILIVIVLTANTNSVLLGSSFSILHRIINISDSLVKDGDAALIETGELVAEIAPEIKSNITKAIADLNASIAKIEEKSAELASVRNELIKDNIMDVRESSEDVKMAITQIVSEYLNSPQEQNQQTKRKKLISDLIKITGKSPAQINAAVMEWEKIYMQAQNQAEDIAAFTSSKLLTIIRKMAWINFCILLLALAAASLGGVYGTRTKKMILIRF